ncbi:MAG: NAD(P)H-binding protein [Gammaproteobacteria bacterium]|nr:NAD(P)H-binding protein [Gammaproteobacteria bacterium]
MKVLVLGGTGTIGSQVAHSLMRRGAWVTILCRSESSAGDAEALGAYPLRGDIATPQQWMGAIRSFDAVIQAAATFDTRISIVDSRLLEQLLEKLGQHVRRRRLVYTGGGWLYGDCSQPVNE